MIDLASLSFSLLKLPACSTKPEEASLNWGTFEIQCTVGPGGVGHSGSSGWWTSIPASRSLIYPTPSCVICMGGGDRSLYIIGIRTCSYYVYFIYSSEESTRICAQLFSSQLMHLDIKVYSVLFINIFIV